MMQKKICMYGLLSAFLCCGTALAQQQQHTVEVIPFGDMDQWIDRQIKESGIIGGALKNVYAIGPTATIRENKAYKNMGGSILQCFPRSVAMATVPVWIPVWKA